MIIPGNAKTPKILIHLGVQGGVSDTTIVDLFKGEIKDGKPSLIDLSDAAFLDSLRRGEPPPPGDWTGQVEEEIEKAIGDGAQSFFALTMQKMGMVGNGAAIEGIGGIASDIASDPNVKKAFEKSLQLDTFSRGLGTAQFQTAGMYASEATELVGSILSAVNQVKDSKNPGEIAAAVSSVALGAASAVLMMVPSPFGITQIIGGVLTAINAIVAAFTGSERDKIAKSVLYQASIGHDAKIASEILKKNFSTHHQQLVMARGGQSRDANGSKCDLNFVFMPLTRIWEKGPVHKRSQSSPWTGWQQVKSNSANRNVAVIFDPMKRPYRGAESYWKSPTADNPTGFVGRGFMPGTMRMSLQMQVPFEPLRDRAGNRITSVNSFRVAQKNKHGKWRDEAIPYSKVDKSSRFGTVHLPNARDLGADFPITNNLCSNIWSTMINRPGPLMYCVDAESLNDAWRIYFESFYDMAEEWWAEGEKDAWAWRSSVLKACSLMTVDWDDQTCSWRATGESDKLPSNWMGKTPKDSKLNLKWSRSIYEQIIRPALINLASRQYEYLHTSIVAYLPEEAAAYKDPNSTIGKTFREARHWLKNSDLKKYLNMDDVIDPKYRSELGSGAGSKAHSGTPVIFSIARGLTIPASLGFQGGAPGAVTQSEIANFQFNLAERRYGASHPSVQMRRNLMEECKNRGAEGQALKTLCEGAMLYNLRHR